MRITGGVHRGRTLKTLSGRRVRPTSDKVRQALFNILGPRVADASVLDLFAGSGSLGLEALSRGAARATFVENDRRALDMIRGNVERLALQNQVTLLNLDVLAGPARLERLEGPFDLVFIDPPYRLTETLEPSSKLGVLLEALWTEEVVREGGVAVLEHDRHSAIAETWENFEIGDRRTYGDTSLAFLKARQ